MDTESQCESGVTERPKGSIWYSVLIFVLSTCWVLYGLVPIIPIGAILCLAIGRPKKRRTYLLVLIAALVGFAGTGFHIAIMKVKKTNVKTGAETYEYTMKTGIRYGILTIDYFLNKGKTVIYDDTSCQEEVDKANAYVAKFVEKYNENDPNFMLDTFSYQQGITREQIQKVFSTVRGRAGDILSSKYLGYLGWIYPNQKYTDISVFHSAELEKNCGLKSIHFRLIFYPDGPKLTRIDFANQKVKYRIVKGMNARNPFLQINADSKTQKEN